MIEDFLDDYIIYCSRLNEEQLWREYDRLSLHYQTKQISKHDFGIQKGEVISCLRNIYIKQLEYYPKKSMEELAENNFDKIKNQKKKEIIKEIFLSKITIIANHSNILLQSKILKQYHVCKEDMLALYHDYHDLEIISKSIFDDHSIFLALEQIQVLLNLLQGDISLQFAEILFLQLDISNQIKKYSLKDIFNDYDFSCDFNYFKQILDNNFSDNIQYNLF